MVEYVVFGASMIILVVLMVLFRYGLSKKTNRKTKIIKNSNIIRQPKFYFYVGIAGIVVFFSMAILGLVAPDNMVIQNDFMERIIICIVLLLVCVPYVFIILFQLNWRVEIGENEFTFTNIWGIKRKYLFEEIVIKQLGRSSKFYCRGKLIIGISYLQDNWFALEKAMMNKQKSKRMKI